MGGDPKSGDFGLPLELETSREKDGTTTPREKDGTTTPRVPCESRDYFAKDGTTPGEEFTDHFGSFNGKKERQRWETLVESIGQERAQEIAAWAERKEIHIMNRGALMDSLETAAKKWTEKPRSGKKTPEENQAKSMEAIRKGIEMAFGGENG